jgi:hypothetical protein
MLTTYQLDRRYAEQALKAGTPTPGHAAAEAAVEAGDQEGAEEARRRRLRVQHEADPCTEPAELPEVTEADLGKRFTQAFDNNAAGYPPMTPPPSAEMFRRPLTRGQASPGADYEPPSVSVHVPRGLIEAGAISPDLLTGTWSCPVTGGPWSGAGTGEAS